MGGRSEDFVLTGYVVPGCVENGAGTAWENSSAADAAVVAAVLADIEIPKSNAQKCAALRLRILVHLIS